MTRVETGSRLHFGLLRPPPSDGRRGFGGCGLMVESPAVALPSNPRRNGPPKDRPPIAVLAVARRVAPDRPHRIVVEACASEHVGLGVGTQLNLAVARAICGPNVPATELARLSGRGGRSAIGVYGFEAGGFLVDGGKRHDDELAPLLVRAAFPAEWRIVLITPPAEPTWHGERERAAFDAMSGTPADDALCRLLLLGMLPALADRDLPAFGEALHEYNVRAGEPFRSAQGGTFAAGSAELIAWLRKQRLAGVGQSSWGPTVFAVVGDPERAETTAAAARRQWTAIHAEETTARNHGAA